MLGSNDLLGGLATDEPLGLGGKKHSRGESTSPARPRKSNMSHMFPEEELKDGERGYEESNSDFNILANRPGEMGDENMFLMPSRVNVASFHSKNTTADRDLRAFSVAHGRLSVRNDQLTRDD